MSKNSQQSSTKHQKYPAYKATGIDWLGKIPKEWDIKRLRFLSKGSFVYGANEEASDDNPDNPRYIRITDIRDDGSLHPDTFRSLPKEVAAPYMLQEGDVLFARSGATVGKTFRYKQSWGTCCFAGYLIRMRADDRKISSEFLYYCTLSDSYSQWKDAVFWQATIQNISAEKYKNFIVGLPSVPEQVDIVEFLDRKTILIDEVIDRKQRLIKLLKEKRQALITQAVTKGLDPNVKLKPTGIDWLGEIPKAWESKRLKYISNTRPSNVDKKSEDDTTVKLCNYVDVYKNEFIDENIEFMSATATLSQIDAFELKRGDVIITKDSETPDDIGVPARVNLENTEHIVCGYHLAIMSPKDNTLFGGYLFRVLQSSKHRSYFETRCNGVTRYGLGTYSVLNVEIPLPPYDEQQSIAGFLDRETAKIDNIVTKVKSQVWKLREYKQALITNAVTGKIKVSK